MSLRDTAVNLIVRYNDGAEIVLFTITSDPIEGTQIRVPAVSPISGKVVSVDKGLLDNTSIKSSDMMLITSEQVIAQSSFIRYKGVDHAIITIIPVYQFGEVVINKVVIRG